MAAPTDLVRTSVVVVASLGVGGAAVAAGSMGGAALGGVPLLGLCVALAFAIQWLAWIPASIARTEKFYDLTGSVTYLSVLALSLAASPRPLSARSLLISAAVAIWALRLGTFLFRRIRRDGKDGRFDELKTSAVRFLLPWTLQGLWVSLTALAVLIVNTRADGGGPLGLLDVAGLAIWALGFGIEVVADRQKAAFRARPGSEGKWIDEGLWSRSRHPNYFGEIVLWTGLAIVGAGVFEGAQWVGVVSPIFVALLLTKGSGVPLLAARARERWGDDPDWQAYQARTRVLLPL
jgi:steroid 5-alpha reductase family enzyme